MGSDGSKELCLTWGSRSPVGRGNFWGKGCNCKVWGHSAVTCAKIAETIVMQFGLWARSASRNHEKDGGWSGMPGHVGQNDTDFTLLQEELNAPTSRPLRPNFAIGPHFDQLWGPTAPKR